MLACVCDMETGVGAMCAPIELLSVYFHLPPPSVVLVRCVCVCVCAAHVI